MMCICHTSNKKIRVTCVQSYLHNNLCDSINTNIPLPNKRLCNSSVSHSLSTTENTVYLSENKLQNLFITEHQILCGDHLN